jgi:hypothetical protein
MAQEAITLIHLALSTALRSAAVMLQTNSSSVHLRWAHRLVTCGNILGTFRKISGHHVLYNSILC